MVECLYCHSSGHVWFQCPKKPDGWKPERVAESSEQRGGREAKAENREVQDPVQKPKPKDTRKGDRHRPGYYRDYMRKYRARQKGNSNDKPC